ncbi:uncharacterized protein LOC135170750 [Diachasmimorpha longicaudata]|uniref:uncharacterized protein LOC135170750 n=1 Tax=Diachasmimorpha longicaudata TaxID=58733 RepID=UPI0030B8B5B9
MSVMAVALIRWRQHWKAMRERCSRLSCLRKTKRPPDDDAEGNVAAPRPQNIAIQSVKVVQEAPQIKPLVISTHSPVGARESPAPTTSNMASPSNDSLTAGHRRKHPHRRKPNRQSKCWSKCSETARLNIENSPQNKCQKKRVKIEFCQHGPQCKKRKSAESELLARTRKSFQGFRDETQGYFKKARERYDSLSSAARHPFRRSSRQTVVNMSSCTSEKLCCRCGLPAENLPKQLAKITKNIHQICECEENPMKMTGGPLISYCSCSVALCGNDDP